MNKKAQNFPFPQFMKQTKRTFSIRNRMSDGFLDFFVFEEDFLHPVGWYMTLQWKLGIKYWKSFQLNSVLSWKELKKILWRNLNNWICVLKVWKYCAIWMLLEALGPCKECIHILSFSFCPNQRDPIVLDAFLFKAFYL